MTRAHVLITGASEGLGREFAKLFAKNGYPLVLAARNIVRLDELAAELRSLYGIDIKAVAVDLSRPEAAAMLKTELDRLGIAVCILVNNAGAGVHGPFARSDWNATASMLALNMTALTQLTRLILPEMIRRGAGKILNVASTAAFQPGPFMACYFATKAYVLSFSEALAEELRGSGVTVTAFCPGPVRTLFQERSGTRHIRENAFAMDAAPAALAAFRGLMRGERVVIPGFTSKLLAFLVRISPGWIVLKVTRFLEEGKQPIGHAP